MSFDYFAEPYSSIFDEDKRRRIEQAMDYLDTINSTEQIEDDQATYEAIFFVAQAVGYKPVESRSFFQDNMEYVETFINILYFIHELVDKYDLNVGDIPVDVPKKPSSSNEKFKSNIAYTTYLLNILFLSMEIRSVFYNYRGINSFILFLKNTEFIKKNMKIGLRLLSLPNDYYLVHLIMLNLNSLSVDSHNNRLVWSEVDAVDVLSNIINILEGSIVFECVSIMSRIADDRQIETFSEINIAADFYIENLRKVAEDFENNRFQRICVQMNDEGENIEIDIHYVMDRNSIRRYMTTICKDLYCLSINDKYRSYLYFEKKINELINPILFKSNYIEAKALLRLLVQLSFNHVVSEDMSKNEQLVDYLKRTVYEQDQNKRLKAACEQIMWNIYIGKLAKEKRSTSPDAKEIPKRHIVISSTASRKFLTDKIKDYLEMEGFEVTRRINEMDNVSLDSMAKTIEKAICVLICVTEHYRQSISCQAEAQYAFTLNKPIIPLIMEQGYENVKGWLGIIMANAHQQINFVQNDDDDDDSLKQLRDAIKKYSNQEAIEKIDNQESKMEENIQNPEEMNCEQVKHWLKKNSTPTNIIEKLGNSDGQVLKQLYEMKKTVPEFYYQSFSNIKELDPISLANFTACLEKLFKK